MRLTPRHLLAAIAALAVTAAILPTVPAGATVGDLPSAVGDVYFYAADCTLLGSTATSNADESGVIPGGTAYVLTQLWTGANVPFTLTATDAGWPAPTARGRHRPRSPRRQGVGGGSVVAGAGA